MKRLRVLFKRWLARHALIIEFCHDCGRKQPLVWTADNDLWEDIHGSGGGIYCPECFDSRCSERGVQLRWRPMVDV